MVNSSFDELSGFSIKSVLQRMHALYSNVMRKASCCIMGIKIYSVLKKAKKSNLTMVDEKSKVSLFWYGL